MRILAVSDQVEDTLYHSTVRERLGHVDLILGCGDLPYYYLEYLESMFDAPLCYVHGNHDPLVEYSSTAGTKTAPEGGDNIDMRCIQVGGLLVAGLEGCIRYRPDGNHQYTQSEMLFRAMSLLPDLLWNRLRHGRWLDVLVAHSPPLGIHDMPTAAHTGFRAFVSLMRTFKPRYLLHGHRHKNYCGGPAETRYGQTLVLNVHPYRIIETD
jgi:Icc-related predicted phosphoesterase